MLSFYTEMISAWFLWGNVLLREELRKDTNIFKFWKFWERSLFKIRSRPMPLNLQHDVHFQDNINFQCVHKRMRWGCPSVFILNLPWFLMDTSYRMLTKYSPTGTDSHLSFNSRCYLQVTFQMLLNQFYRLVTAPIDVTPKASFYTNLNPETPTVTRVPRGRWNSSSNNLLKVYQGSLVPSLSVQFNKLEIKLQCRVHRKRFDEVR